MLFRSQNAMRHARAASIYAHIYKDYMAQSHKAYQIMEWVAKNKSLHDSTSRHVDGVKKLVFAPLDASSPIANTAANEKRAQEFAKAAEYAAVEATSSLPHIYNFMVTTAAKNTKRAREGVEAATGPETSPKRQRLQPKN